MWSVTLSVRRNVYVAVMVALAVCGGVIAAQAAMVQDDVITQGLRVAPIGMDPEIIGSGDGRIHIIPSLSAPSVKNGERLTIQAVVKAMDGVASVTARSAA